MALWFPIMVNNFSIGQVSLVRTNPVDHKPEQNEVCTYSLKYYEHSQTPVVQTSIEFPYQEKNPIPLLSAALERVKECQST